MNTNKKKKRYAKHFIHEAKEFWQYHGNHLQGLFLLIFFFTQLQVGGALT